MDLVEVDVVGLQPSEAGLYFAQDVHAGRAAPVEIPAHRQSDFCGKDNLVSQALQGISHESLALPEAVYVGCIDEVDPAVQG